MNNTEVFGGAKQIVNYVIMADTLFHMSKPMPWHIGCLLYLHWDESWHSEVNGDIITSTKTRIQLSDKTTETTFYGEAKLLRRFLTREMNIGAKITVLQKSF